MHRRVAAIGVVALTVQDCDADVGTHTCQALAVLLVCAAQSRTLANRARDHAVGHCQRNGLRHLSAHCSITTACLQKTARKRRRGTAAVDQRVTLVTHDRYATENAMDVIMRAKITKI